MRPEIGFKDFTKDWEQRKLADVAQFSKGNGYSKADLTESGTPIILYGRLYTKYETRISNVDTFAEAKTDSVYSKGGEVIVPASGETAEDIARAAAVENAGVLLGGDLNVITPNDDINSEFLALSISNGATQRELAKKAQGKSVVHIHNEDIRNLVISFPNIEEQKNIAEQIFNLDYLINLYHRKYKRFVNIKKSMLTKMFPQEGSKVPEIRFKGFTDDWEQRKLGEIIQERTVRTSDFDNNPLYSLTIENGITPKTDRYERSSLVTKTEDLFKVVKPNEFVTNPMNLRFGALGYNTNTFSVSVSGYYDVFSIDDDRCSGFWNSYFKTSTAMKIFDNAATGSLIEKRRVKYSTLQQLNFYMPRELSEKIKIGRYMDTLDHLITLHQREIKKLQDVKKALLNKMFV